MILILGWVLLVSVESWIDVIRIYMVGFALWGEFVPSSMALVNKLKGKDMDWIQIVTSWSKAVWLGKKIFGWEGMDSMDMKFYK